MNENSLNPDEMGVEAEYYFKSNRGDSSLTTAKIRVMNVMGERGYDVLHRGERVWDFISRQNVPKPSIGWQVKSKLGLVDKSEHVGKYAIKNLRETRDDHPYIITFRFIPVQWENGDDGYTVEVEAIPALSEKIDRLDGDFSDVSPQRSVRTCKRELRNIATEVGLMTAREPFVKAENYQDTINQHLRQQLQEYKYGDYVTNFTDEGDEAFRYSLFRPAICAYIHAIEWAIICYIETVDSRDVIEEEGYGWGEGFTGLIDEVENTGAVSQTTFETLQNFNDRRIWMAHHKSGPVTDLEVRQIKQRLGILLEELFL